MTSTPADLTTHVVGTSERIAASLGRVIPPGGLLRLVSPERGATLDALITQASVTEAAIARLALLQDGLRVCIRMLMADDQLESREAEAVAPLVDAILPFLRAVRATYEGLTVRHPDDVRGFLALYLRDSAPFGGNSARTSFLGHAICRGAAATYGASQPLELYERMMVELLDLVQALGSGHAAEGATRKKLEDELALQVASQVTSPGAMVAPDRRLEQFLIPGGMPVFSGIAHANEVWTADPFDVEAVHAEARSVFRRAVDQVSAQDPPTHGQILLLLGESGAGKTHLLRAFRNQVHAERRGYVAYMQLTTATDSYPRYILRKVVDSLDHAYDPPNLEKTGLDVLAESIVDALPQALREHLSNEALDGRELARVLGRAADTLMNQNADFARAGADLLSVLLCLARPGKATRARAVKWLRCDPLDPYSVELLGGIPARTEAGDVVVTLTELGRLMWAQHGRLMVLLFDQIEELAVQSTEKSFRAVAHALVHIMAEVPGSVSVLGCIEDHWTALSSTLTKPIVDRIVLDPEPVRLVANRSLDEIESIVGRRLAVGFATHDIEVRDDDPLYPLSRDDLKRLANLRTRDALDWCRQYQNRCAAEGRLVDASEIGRGPDVKPTPTAIDLERAWNDFLTTGEFHVPDDERDLASLLAWAAHELAAEAGFPSPRVHADGRFVEIVADSGSLVVAVCDKGAQGGGLRNQLDELAQRAASMGAYPVVLRSSDYPSNPNTQVAKTLGRLLATGGRRYVFSEIVWRSLAGHRAFLGAHAGKEGMDTWRRTSRPLSSIEKVAEALTVPAIRPDSRAPKPPPHPGPPEPIGGKLDGGGGPTKPIPLPVAAGRIFQVGRTRSLKSESVSMEFLRLTRNAGFLGSPGSGKTTLALNLVEQAAMQGVPALLVDRKGDLAAYVAPECWERPEMDSERARRRAALRERLDVLLFTPGESRGRPLALPLVPNGLAALPDADRSIMAQRAAAAVGGMMGYTGREVDRKKQAVLGKAIEVLASLGGGEPTIERLVELIDDRDDALVAAIGRLDDRIFKRLVDDLEVLRLGSGHLLGEGSEVLDADRLFGLGPHAIPGKTRLTVLSTKFLGETRAVQFWMSRLFLELERWVSKSPKNDLQALLLLDEADQYIPANRKPPSKEPLDSLIRRGRSAGLGVLLASQSPGDFDYQARDNVNTWFLGRIAGTTAIDKMKPLLQEARRNPAERLPTLNAGEFFHLADREAVEIKGQRCLIEPEQLPEARILELAASR